MLGPVRTCISVLGRRAMPLHLMQKLWMILMHSNPIPRPRNLRPRKPQRERQARRPATIKRLGRARRTNRPRSKANFDTLPLARMIDVRSLHERGMYLSFQIFSMGLKMRMRPSRIRMRVRLFTRYETGMYSSREFSLFIGVNTDLPQFKFALVLNQ